MSDRPGSRIRRLLDRLPSEIAAFLALSASSVANQFVRFFTGIINARLLTPVLYATNSIAMLAVRYASYGHLGVQNGLNRQLPIEYGREDRRAADEFLYSAFWFILGIIGILCVATAVLFFGRLLPTGLVDRSYYGDILLLTIATLMYQYFVSYLICTHQFRLLAELRAKYDLPALIVTMLAVVAFRLHGLLLVQSASMAIQIAVLVVRSGFRPKRVFMWSRITPLLRAGSPILISSLLIYAFMTVDLMFVSGRYDRVSVGIYGFANSAVFSYRTYAVSMSDVLQPKIGNEFGASGEKPSSLRRFVVDYTYAIAPLLGMIGAVFFFLLPVVITVGLRSYARAALPFQYLLLAEYFLSLYIPSGHVITLLRKQAQLVAIILAGIGGASLLFLRFVTPETQLTTVSLIWLLVSVGVSFSIILYSTFLTSRETGMPWKPMIRNFFTAFVVAGLLIGIAAVPAPAGIAWSIVFALLRLLVAEVALFGVFMSLDPSNPIVRRVRGLLRHHPEVAT